MAGAASGIHTRMRRGESSCPAAAVLIVAGGSGSRAGGGVAKQYRTLAGRPVLRRSIEAFLDCPRVSAIQVVVGREQEAAYTAATLDLELRPPAIGGETRQDSVRNGLRALVPVAPDFVLIHDAARPLVSRTTIEAVMGALTDGASAVVPMLPLADSLRRLNGGVVGQAVSRDGLRRVQTPQGFCFRDILAAHEQFIGANATDDISLAEQCAMPITAVDGEPENLKLTTMSDFCFAERLLVGAAETRSGMGFDVHRFVPGDHLWLCGVRVPHDQTLEGHSDADAGLHALTDAILGALAHGDIGQHFPPSDERWRGAPSSAFLEHAASLMRSAGGAIAHCDITIICERPRLAPYREAMRVRVAAILNIEVSRINIKATTTEGLGFTGRGEGLAAQAIATIRVPA
jgi:2-C-methyl-D-erythritol 4-phosphate cytidylyltransferase/2-C-methyl-D-erythritol 2,4-cyclodiphosphate synthase